MKTLGIIGGSGLYEVEGFSTEELVEMETPYGAPSAPLRIGTIWNTRVVFLPRHGNHHDFTPS